MSSAELAEAGLTGWRLTSEALTATFRTRKFATGLELVNRIGASAEEVNHHPDLTLTYSTVGVTLSSHDVGGITSRDIDLARIISGHAADLGLNH
ncbi:4a-hydroxytetrahydrobiopterin dehydratase [Pseudarthrobacter enclensis]|uniref:4a-hydroxytetrahydrobiopterin dehydratase n=1 Tax=Pseudarthrobacter enclensis TaxID=993070 RepID=UPI0027D82E4A|nr:4a-hydroxytetrahydrobiopterin dehydratase [Pseudarthrobacter enclensis]